MLATDSLADLSHEVAGLPSEIDAENEEELAEFTNGRTLTANQLEFINLIVDHLTEHGVVEAERLYASPFTDLTPHGPDSLFEASELDELLRTLQAVRATAIAA